MQIKQNDTPPNNKDKIQYKINIWFASSFQGATWVWRILRMLTKLWPQWFLFCINVYHKCFTIVFHGVNSMEKLSTSSQISVFLQAFIIFVFSSSVSIFWCRSHSHCRSRSHSRRVQNCFVLLHEVPLILLDIQSQSSHILLIGMKLNLTPIWRKQLFKKR